MRKIFEFIKKYWLVIMVVLAAILYVINFFLKGQAPTIAPTPTQVAQTASYNNIFPGVSTESDLNKSLGAPLKTTISGNIKTDEYKSTSELRHHIAIIQGEKVSFIKEIVSAHDTTTATSITNIYGKAPKILYGKSSNSTFNLYIYPSNGIAYLGHADGTLLEIWYFQPTSFEDFVSKWGQDYSTTPSTEVVQ
jgi:hypothetical protein